MSLRDHFAGMAMQSMVAGITKFRKGVGLKDTLIVNRPKDVSELAYLYADAMLKARRLDVRRG